MDVTIAATKLKAEKKEVYSRHGTSNAKAVLTPLLGGPLVIGGLAVVSSAALKTSLAGATGETLAWIPLLAHPDPMYILPTLGCCLTLCNIELSLRNPKNGGSLDGIAAWVVRGGAVVVLPVVAHFPAAMVLYLLGLSSAGILQPLLMRSATFRNFFGVPQPPSLALNGSGAESKGSKGLSFHKVAPRHWTEGLADPLPKEQELNTPKGLATQANTWSAFWRQRFRLAMPRFSKIVEASSVQEKERIQERQKDAEKRRGLRADNKWRAPTK